MTNMTMDRRELLIRNRDTIKNVFKWDTGLMHLCCANIYTMRGQLVDESSLRQTKQLLTERVGAFNNFRSTARNVLIAMLDLSGDAPALLERALQLYDMLKREFFTSSYLPMVAMLLAEHASPARYDELVARTRTIYKRMQREHPMLTSSEDCALCALLAMSDQTDDELIDRMEQCYTMLKDRFTFYGNQLQSLSHVMALSSGDIGDKCDRMLALIDALKAAGHKWSKSYELPVLGILVEDPRPIEELASAIADHDAWLQTQKGFGFFSSVSRMQRLMYAALLTQEQGAAADTAAINSTISMIIAEQVSLIAVTSAVTAANSGSHS